MLDVPGAVGGRGGCDQEIHEGRVSGFSHDAPPLKRGVPSFVPVHLEARLSQAPCDLGVGLTVKNSNLQGQVQVLCAGVPRGPLGEGMFSTH